MGVSGAVFESAGKRTMHWIPGVFSRRNTVPAGTGTIASNLVVMGKSLGGEPLKMIPCADVTEARELLAGGQLLEGVANAFNGSNDSVPQQVWAFRVNKGTRSGITLKNGETDILTVNSGDYGIHTNQLKIWIQDGTEEGSKKIKLNFRGNEIEHDNIIRKSIAVQYIGDGSKAAMKINRDGAIITVTDDPDANMSISWEECDTLEALAARLNDTGLFNVRLVDERPDVSTSNLDTTSDENITTEVVFKSNLAAFCEALNAMQYIGEITVVSTSLFAPPENTDTYVYFSGASDGTYTVQDWVDALAVLENEEVQSIVTPSTDHDVRILASNHITSMCQTEKRKERQGFFGLPKNISLDDAILAAKELNSEYVSLVIDDAIANNPLTGKTENLDPGMLACKLAGMEAAMGMAEPLTNKQVKVNSFGMKHRTSELNAMIQNGIMPCGINEEGLLVVIRAMTTFQDDNLGLNERSCVREALFMDRDLRKAFSRRTGTATEPSTDEIISTLLRKAEEWYVLGYITKSDAGEMVFDITVRFEGDKTYLVYSKFLRTPNNFTFITSNNMIYSSARAA